MPPTNGLEAARDFVDRFATAKGFKGTDLVAFKNLLDATSYIVRSEISTGTWAFARFREELTAAVTANSGTTAVIVPSNKWAGELVLVQLTPTSEKGRVTYIDPAGFEELMALDATSDQDPKVYTIYNSNELYFWPPTEAGDTFMLAGQTDLMDVTAELPMRFASYLACIFLYFIGAPPPNDHTTWMDAAKKKLNELKETDRPSSRGTNFDIPFEEASFTLGNA